MVLMVGGYGVSSMGALSQAQEGQFPKEGVSQTLDLTQWPTRNFLPPVATINPKLDDVIDDVVTADDELEVVSLASVNTPVLTTRPAVERLDTRVDVLSDEDKARQRDQKAIEEADLNALWEATVERNPVIRFSLEKLATPEDLAQEQSSIFMRKTLGVLISGATLASTMLPGAGGFGGYRNMGVMAGGDALRNLTGGKQTPNAQRLTATEKIQLAGMIDDLQRNVIQAYHDYRRSLQALSIAHGQTTRAEELYHSQMRVVEEMPSMRGDHGEAMGAMQSAMLMTQGAAFHQASLQETRLKQEAKGYRLQLERLAGVDAVASLQLIPAEGDTVATATSAASGEGS
jgi:hypothetical protein